MKKKNKAERPCQFCGYDLVGLGPLPRCPECGQVQRKMEWRLGWSQDRAKLAKAGAIALICFSLSGFSAVVFTLVSAPFMTGSLFGYPVVIIVHGFGAVGSSCLCLAVANSANARFRSRFIAVLNGSLLVTASLSATAAHGTLFIFAAAVGIIVATLAAFRGMRYLAGVAWDLELEKNAKRSVERLMLGFAIMILSLPLMLFCIGYLTILFALAIFIVGWAYGTRDLFTLLKRLNECGLDPNTSYCPSCRYEMTGIEDEAICPECGAGGAGR